MNNQAPKRRYGIRPNKYEIRKGVVYMMTRNDPSTIIKFDKKDLEKVLEYSWSTHSFKCRGNTTVSHRYRELKTGKWKEMYLSTHLGYGKGWCHKNGDILDFTSKNMVKKGYWFN